MARAEMPYAVKKSNKRISNEMLTQSQQQERSMQYPNTQKPEKVTSRLGTFPSLRNGCLPTSRLIHDGCLPSHEVGKTALPYLTDPDFEQRTSPEPDFAPPSKHSSRKADPGAHSSRHSSKSKEPPLPTTVRQAHPERKTVPTLCPKVREPPPPIEVRRSNPNVNTVPVLTPKVREAAPRRHSPEAGSSRSHSGSGSKSGKRGRRRKREEDDFEAPSTSGLHYTVESDKNKPFTLRLKINRLSAPAPSGEAGSSKSDKRPRPLPTEERWRKAGGSRDGCDAHAERRDSKRSGHGKRSGAPPCTPSKRAPAVDKNRAPDPSRIVRSVRIKEPEPCSSHTPSTSYKARTSFSGTPGKMRNESNAVKEQIPSEPCLSDDTCKPRGRRKKGYNSEETMNELPSLVPDKMRTSVPEVTRGPRIKTLQEILDSLNIQLDDNSRFDARSQPCGSRDVANGSAATSSDHWDRHVSRTEQPRKRAKAQAASAAPPAPPPAHPEGADACKAESEENPDDCSKRIKIIISGEVSRRPTKPPSGSSSKASRASRESGENSDDEDEQDESDSDSAERKMQKEREREQKQEKRRRVKMMAKKQEAGDREELKEILQARCSLRKEMDDLDDASDEAEAKAKPVPSAPGSSRKPRPLGITSPRDSDSEEEKGGAAAAAEGGGKGGAEPDRWDRSASSAEEESSEPSGYESPVMKSVEQILSQLPPISEAAVDLSDPSEDACRARPLTSTEVRRLVERMATERIEGVTGTTSHEGSATTFREWHEAATRPSRNGEALVLLPYVVID